MFTYQTPTYQVLVGHEKRALYLNVALWCHPVKVVLGDTDNFFHDIYREKVSRYWLIEYITMFGQWRN